MSKLILSLAIVILIISTYLIFKNFPPSTNPIQNFSNPSTGNPQNVSIPPPAAIKNSAPRTPSAPTDLAFPIDQFEKRITKKPFGIFITPQNSPVQPERFQGYHTGVDIEYGDVTSNVPVYALADATVVLARRASGYGGVLVIRFKIKGVERTALYGHLQPASLPSVGQKVKKGETIGLLGTGYSPETDGERKHLHFAILNNDRIDLRGYVQKKSELSGWLDPLSLYR